MKFPFFARWNVCRHRLSRTAQIKSVCLPKALSKNDLSCVSAVMQMVAEVSPRERRTEREAARWFLRRGDIASFFLFIALELQIHPDPSHNYSWLKEKLKEAKPVKHCTKTKHCVMTEMWFCV